MSAPPAQDPNPTQSPPTVGEDAGTDPVPLPALDASQSQESIIEPDVSNQHALPMFISNFGFLS